MAVAAYQQWRTMLFHGKNANVEKTKEEEYREEKTKATHIPKKKKRKRRDGQS
jgi:hypothetical protein